MERRIMQRKCFISSTFFYLYFPFFLLKSKIHCFGMFGMLRRYGVSVFRIWIVVRKAKGKKEDAMEHFQHIKYYSVVGNCMLTLLDGTDYDCVGVFVFQFVVRMWKIVAVVRRNLSFMQLCMDVFCWRCTLLIRHTVPGCYNWPMHFTLRIITSECMEALPVALPFAIAHLWMQWLRVEEKLLSAQTYDCVK